MKILFVFCLQLFLLFDIAEVSSASSKNVPKEYSAIALKQLKNIKTDTKNSDVDVVADGNDLIQYENVIQTQKTPISCTYKSGATDMVVGTPACTVSNNSVKVTWQQKQNSIPVTSIIVDIEYPDESIKQYSQTITVPESKRQICEENIGPNGTYGSITSVNIKNEGVNGVNYAVSIKDVGIAEIAWSQKGIVQEPDIDVVVDEVCNSISNLSVGVVDVTISTSSDGPNCMFKVMLPVADGFTATSCYHNANQSHTDNCEVIQNQYVNAYISLPNGSSCDMQYVGNYISALYVDYDYDKSTHILSNSQYYYRYDTSLSRLDRIIPEGMLGNGIIVNEHGYYSVCFSKIFSRKFYYHFNDVYDLIETDCQLQTFSGTERYNLVEADKGVDRILYPSRILGSLTTDATSITPPTINKFSGAANYSGITQLGENYCTFKNKDVISKCNGKCKMNEAGNGGALTISWEDGSGTCDATNGDAQEDFEFWRASQNATLTSSDYTKSGVTNTGTSASQAVGNIIEQKQITSPTKTSAVNSVATSKATGANVYLSKTCDINEILPVNTKMLNKNCNSSMRITYATLESQMTDIYPDTTKQSALISVAQCKILDQKFDGTGIPYANNFIICENDSTQSCVDEADPNNPVYKDDGGKCIVNFIA